MEPRRRRRGSNWVESKLESKGGWNLNICIWVCKKPKRKFIHLCPFLTLIEFAILVEIVSMSKTCNFDSNISDFNSVDLKKAKKWSKDKYSGSTFFTCLSLPSKSHRENSISSIYFGIPWSNRQEKYCQMLEIFFPYFTTLETYRAQSTFFRDTLYLVTNKVNKFDRKGRRWILLLSCLLQPQNIQVSIRQTLKFVFHSI